MKRRSRSISLVQTPQDVSPPHKTTSYPMPLYSPNHVAKVPWMALKT